MKKLRKPAWPGLVGALVMGTLSIGLAGISHAQGFDHGHTVAAHEFKSHSGETVDAELGTFVVPENRHSQSERTITLRYIRFPATTDQPGNPFVYLAGGPGGSGTGAARGTRFRLFAQLRELGDVIAFDQRGTGMSDHPPGSNHSWNVPLSEAGTRQVVTTAMQQALAKCKTDWLQSGVDLEAYNTEENADDLEALRSVLGAEQLRLWGISYGTHLGICYMRRHPAAVERAVLAGVEGPDHTAKLPSHQQQLLQQIDEWSRESQATETHPDFLESVARVLSRLESAPHVIKRNGKVAYTITKFDVQHVTAQMLGGPNHFRRLPALFAAMDDGDFSSMVFYMNFVRRGSFSPMNAATDAASGVSQKRIQRIADEAQTTLLSDAINLEDNIVRRALGVRDLGEAFRAPLVTDIPVLLISGTADGRTPPANAYEVAKHLENSSHLVISYAGHSDPLFLSSPKILEIMKSFFSGQRVADTQIELPKIW